MSEKMIEIKGKKVSEETIAAALKEYHDFEEKEVTAPIISVAALPDGEEVAIIRLSDDMFEYIAEDVEHVLVIDGDGEVLVSEYDQFYEFKNHINCEHVFGTLIKKTKKCRKRKVTKYEDTDE